MRGRLFVLGLGLESREVQSRRYYRRPGYHYTPLLHARQFSEVRHSLPLRLSLLAGQGELERLHVLDLLVLTRFLDLDVLEDSRLLQVGDQIRHRVRPQGGPFTAYGR